jgi:hypothetical protein
MCGRVDETGWVDEQQLVGGIANAGRVVRVGPHVLRPSSPHSGSIHASLRAVRHAGFEGASLPVGIDEDGRERLVFVDGEVPVAPYPDWSQSDTAFWDRQGIMTAGPRTMAEIVAHHLRNVEVHHVDLDIGYRPSDWPPHFVDNELAKRLRALPDRADHADLLAWLLGRAPAPELGPW